MSLHTKFLIELFQTFPEDAIVRGFAEGLAVTNADGSGELAMLDDNVVFQPGPRSPSVFIHLLPKMTGDSSASLEESSRHADEPVQQAVDACVTLGGDEPSKVISGCMPNSA
jgi:hypothetical protein